MSKLFKPGTFIVVPNKHKLASLTTKAKLAWIALCAHTDDNGECWPSIQTLSEMSGVSQNTLRGGIEELVFLKMVRKVNRKTKNGDFTSNYYTLYLVD